MSFIEWTPEFSVGVEALDQDHKDLILFINNLHAALLDGSIETVTEETLNIMTYHSKEHFRREEELFAQTDYPEAEAHKKMHEQFTRQLLEIKGRFMKNPSKEISLEFILFVKKWAVEHMQEADMKYVPYLKEKGFK
ncbi:MAG: bacteriohemerythrin [Alphaproteobacteria bacterium]|nr:bacteriohemerythrin [Alphaproteobacteria bacterium]